MLTGLLVDPHTGDIVYVAADDQQIEFPVIDYTGAAQSLAGWSFRLTVKKHIADAIGDAKFQKQSPALNGIDVEPGSVTGLLVVSVDKADVASLSGRHVYDLVGTDAAGKEHTIANATITFAGRVTTDGVPGTASGVMYVVPEYPGGIAFPDFFFMRDQVDDKWVKFRLYNRNWEPVAESASAPPF